MKGQNKRFQNKNKPEPTKAVVHPGSMLIGEYWVKLPTTPPLETIKGYNLPKNKQKWKRTELYHDHKRDMDWEDLRAEELLKQSPYIDIKGEPTYEVKNDNPDFIDYDYVNPEMQFFRDQEWDRRIKGFWFMNNGVPTYITGSHYFYLNYWPLDDGYPIYRACDRRFFLLWKDVDESPDDWGLAEITRRRQGKSWRASCIMYERISRTPKVNGGMQSKESGAAKDWFTEKLVGPWKEMPDFFQPLSNSGTDPVKALEFKAPKIMGKKAKGYKIAELRSKITWGPATETHYDGQKLNTYISDEFGKCVESDVVKRHYIVKKSCTLVDKIVGKMYYTTTVEEMEKGGGENAKKLWDDSAPNPKGGRNRSGLRRLFQPAYEGFLLDEFGNDLIEESKKSILDALELLKGDPRAYNAEKRFMPFVIDDCWGKDGTKCHFDPVKVGDRYEYLKMLESIGKPLYEIGALKWENNIRDTKVHFVKNPNGRFKITLHPELLEQNNVTRDNHDKPVKPNNKTKYIIGIDPFEHEFVTGTVMSNGAAYGFRKYDDTIDGKEHDIRKWRTNRFVVEYIARPTPKVFFEDMIMLCVYLGCQMHFERQKIAIRNYFKERGYSSFMMERPEGTYTNLKQKDRMEGTPNSTTMLNSITDHIDSYVSEDMYGDDSLNDGINHGYISLVDFPNLCLDWFNFDIEDTKKYDATIASGFTLIGASKFIRPTSNKLNTAKYFQAYEQTGSVSSPILGPDEEGEGEYEEVVLSEDVLEKIKNDPYLQREYGLYNN